MYVVDQLGVVPPAVSSNTVNELVLNPRVCIRPIQIDERVVAYLVNAPVRGRGRLERTVAVDATRPAVIDVLSGLVAAEDDVEVDDEACAELVALGVLVEAHEISQQVRFACHVSSHTRAPATSLVVRSGVCVVARDDLAAREPDLARVLEASPYVVLVTDPATGARYPYQISHREHALMQRLTPGSPPPADVAADDLLRLVSAGVLMEERALDVARDGLRAATEQFTRHGYAVISQILPPPQLGSLREYFQQLVQEGYAASQDKQVSLRSALHNERLMRYYHHELCGVFARVVDSPIKPSYSYFASYRRGATLERHVDREQCKFTASVLLDYAARPGDDSVWPLYLDLPATGERAVVELSPGDCVLFCGQVQPHYRYELRANASTSLLFHYVDESFAGSLQ